MNYCNYAIILNGEVFLNFGNYTELMNYLRDKELASDITDIVFSKDRQKSLIDKIKLNNVKDLKLVESVDPNDPSPAPEGGLNVLLFINSSAFNINDHLLVPTYEDGNYDAKVKLELAAKGWNDELIDLHLKTEKQLNELIKKDAKYVHMIAGSKILFELDGAKVLGALKNKGISEEKIPNLAVVLDALRKTFISETGELNSEKLTIRGVNLKAKIKSSGEDIYGHFDWITIGDDGTIRLYVIKTTASNPNEWPQVKKERIKYLLAFLKSILEYNGVNTKNILLSVIPVLLQYGLNGNLLKAKVHGTINYSTRKSDSGFAMHKYVKNASYFIENNSTPITISSNVIVKATDNCKLIFPTMNLREDGLGQTAESWIKYAPSEDPTGIEPIIIKKVNELDHMYEVIIDGKLYDIKEKTDKNKNKEIKELITKHLDKLDDNKGYTVLKIKDAVKNAYEKGFLSFEKVTGLATISQLLESIFSKYLLDYTKEEVNGKEVINHNWKLLDDLIDAGILIFKSKDGVIDVITLSNFNIKLHANIRRNRNNILGFYKQDTEYNDLESDYGNVEAVRTMELINEMLPELGDNIILGTLGVVSSCGNGAYRAFNIGEFNKNYFLKILSIVNEANPDNKINNNFLNTTFTDPIEEIFNEYNKVTDGANLSLTKEYERYGFETLKDAKTKVTLIQALTDIITKIQTIRPDFGDPEKVARALEGSSKFNKNLATLYVMSVNALLTLRGETAINKNSLSSINLNFFTAATVDDENIRTVVNNLLITYDTVSEEFLKYYDSKIRGMFDDFYKYKNYTSALNMIIGNLASVYRNLYDPDSDAMSFKNPYDESNDLDSEERTLLKKVLYQILCISRNGNSIFTSPEDPKIKEYIKRHPEYLWVPLERASKGTQRSSAAGIVTGMKNFVRKIRDASTAFDEFVEGITEEEREMMSRDSENFYRMHLVNPFSTTMVTSTNNYNSALQERKRWIEKYGTPFFETNVENLLIDFLAKHISTTQLNKLLVCSKALMLQLYLTGNYNGNKSVVEKEIKYMQDYLKVNVFHTSIMSKTELKIIGVISPIKRIVTHMLLGGNIIGSLRDTFEGAEQNFMRSFIKLNTDIEPENVRKAYAYVFKYSTANPMALNLLSKLCLKYRISNTDIGRIAERAKTGRSGILNGETFMYSTLRGPDFLNRMTLFVAKCMHDGSWEAFSLDQNGNLKYDWTKDERFKAFKYGAKGSKEYLKARALYFSQVKKYNEDHLDAPINMTDNLPEPYSKREINAIRALGDNIYGSYDTSKKAMAEHRAYGFLFGSFSTWMNGIVNNYFMSTLKNGVSLLTSELETDEKGNKLFFDEVGNITTEDTGSPVYKDIPIIVLGIFPSIGSIISLCKEDGLKAGLAYIKGNPMVKANMYKLSSDALSALLLGLLYLLILGPKYTEFKKTAKDNPMLKNFFTEILYKSSSRSFDLFKGPINVILFFGENMNPPYYTAPVLIVKLTGQSLFGDKSWKYLLLNNTGLTRSIKDTANAYFKSQL